MVLLVNDLFLVVPFVRGRYDLFLVVPFVRGRYELFLAMLWKVRYFLCCHLLLRSVSFLVVYYGALLQCRSNFRWVLVTGPCDVSW